MKVSDIAEKLKLKVFNGGELMEKCVDGCFVGDLLSLAMSKVEKNDVWVTIQTNINVIAVASLSEASCVIIAEGFEPENNTIEKAKLQNIILLGSSLSAYEIVKGIVELGI